MPENNDSTNVPGSADWREIAEKASQETDPKKLIQLVQELCQKLEQAQQERKKIGSP